MIKPHASTYTIVAEFFPKLKILGSVSRRAALPSKEYDYLFLSVVFYLELQLHLASWLSQNDRQ